MGIYKRKNLREKVRKLKMLLTKKKCKIQEKKKAHIRQRKKVNSRQKKIKHNLEHAIAQDKKQVLRSDCFFYKFQPQQGNSSRRNMR